MSVLHHIRTFQTQTELKTLKDSCVTPSTPTFSCLRPLIHTPLSTDCAAVCDPLLVACVCAHTRPKHNDYTAVYDPLPVFCVCARHVWCVDACRCLHVLSKPHVKHHQSTKSPSKHRIIPKVAPWPVSSSDEATRFVAGQWWLWWVCVAVNVTSARPPTFPRDEITATRFKDARCNSEHDDSSDTLVSGGGEQVWRGFQGCYCWIHEHTLAHSLYGDNSQSSQVVKCRALLEMEGLFVLSLRRRRV